MNWKCQLISICFRQQMTRHLWNFFVSSIKIWTVVGMSHDLGNRKVTVSMSTDNKTRKRCDNWIRTCIISLAAQTRAAWTRDGSSLGDSSAAARRAWTMWGMVSLDITRECADIFACDAALLFDLAATVDEFMSWVDADAARLHACCQHKFTPTNESN